MDKTLLNLVSAERLRADLFHFCRDPFSFRTVSYKRPWHEKNSLEEFDEFLADEIRRYTPNVELIPNKVQAFRCNDKKPLHHWYDGPHADDPWYDANKIVVTLPGSEAPEDIIQLVSHKDSMSWINSPGAHDNAVGTACNLELIRVLSQLPHKRTIRVLFCNEEHCPWHSLTFAKAAFAHGDRILAVFNQDSICGKSEAALAAGLKTNVSAYSTPEGKVLADFIVAEANTYELPLLATTDFKERVNDDDGSFIKAGYPRTVMNIGSQPYGDDQYHLPGDVPERVDFVNLSLVAKLLMACVLDIDAVGEGIFAQG